MVGPILIQGNSSDEILLQNGFLKSGICIGKERLPLFIRQTNALVRVESHPVPRLPSPCLILK